MFHGICCYFLLSQHLSLRLTTYIYNNANNEFKRYLGASETPFKERFRNYTTNFKHKTYEKCTELSKYIWTLKSDGITPIGK